MVTLVMGMLTFVLGMVTFVLGMVTFVLGMVAFVLGMVTLVMGMVTLVLGMVTLVLGMVTLGVIGWLLHVRLLVASILTMPCGRAGKVGATRVLGDPGPEAISTIIARTDADLSGGRKVVAVVTAGVGGLSWAVAGVALWRHLQVGPCAVVARACRVAEVDDAALVRALVRRTDGREAELMGDVAPGNLHHLAKRERDRERWRENE